MNQMNDAALTSTGLLAAAIAALIGSSQVLADSGPNAKDLKTAQETAARINALPGAKIKAEDLMHPPIKGFHPLGKLLKPLTNLESTTDKLDAKANGLQQPINELNKPMVGLQQEMVSVDHGVGKMTKTMDGVSNTVAGARQDMASIRQEIGYLKKPIVALQEPVEAIAKPLESVEGQLNLVLCALLAGPFIVAFGTPMAAVLIYRNRHKFLGSIETNNKPAPEAATRP
ncbi:MAG TPA: hypothetical protein V6C69_17830 [Trichormus sp.]